MLNHKLTDNPAPITRPPLDLVQELIPIFELEEVAITALQAGTEAMLVKKFASEFLFCLDRYGSVSIRLVVVINTIAMHSGREIITDEDPKSNSP